MSEADFKPLNWKPEPGIGYTVTRRPDGGMSYTFTDVSRSTLEHWREFALQHLYDSDRLTRNLYDLRQVRSISAEAIDMAVEANSDPAARHIRVAVVVEGDAARVAIQQVADLTAGGGVELGIFTDLPEAEAWLDRPLTTLV
jgi:hypothetical protein